MKRLSVLNPSVKLLTDFYTADTETGTRDGNRIKWELKGRPEKFIFGVIYGYNYTKICHSLKEFIDTFKEPRFYNRKVFFHNLPYDGNTIFDNIFYVDPGAIFNGKLISFTNGNCTFADSTNIFVGQSIKKIGKQIGKEKIGMSGGEYTVSDWSKEDEKTRDINGCIRDCEIAYDALLNTFEFAGAIKITQASLSMTYFQRFHLQHDIEHNANTKYFWDSYYGGRTEAFKLGATHASVIDVNSMYPDAMKNCIFPNPKFLKVEENVNIEYFLNNILPHYEGCIYATVSHKKSWLGCLPVRYNNKLLFPTGTFAGCWNFNEFRFAILSGFIEPINIQKVVYSERMLSPFVQYVDKCFELKFKAELSGNEFERDRTKRFANSLYGKFAQRVTEEYIYLDDIRKNIDLIREHQKKRTFIKLNYFNADRNDAFLVVKSLVGKQINYSIPSFASYITSYARVSLLKQLLKMEKNRPVYCDTDSIFYEIDDESIENSSALGEWKKEKKIITYVHGLKNYEYRYFDKELNKWCEKHRIKGVPEKRELVIDPSDGRTIYKYSNLVKTKEALRRNLDAGIMIERTKKLSGKYDKRIVLENGETLPIELSKKTTPKY